MFKKLASLKRGVRAINETQKTAIDHICEDYTKRTGWLPLQI